MQRTSIGGRGRNTLFCRKLMEALQARRRGSDIKKRGLLGVSENLDKNPEHRRREYANVQVRSTDDAGEETAHASKVVNPFTHALAPPFRGRRRDFYNTKMPSNLWNIRSVNIYMNVLYIPYIYNPATSSHIKPGLLR
jgi:hypothetical protein